MSGFRRYVWAVDKYTEVSVLTVGSLPGHQGDGAVELELHVTKPCLYMQEGNIEGKLATPLPVGWKCPSANISVYTVHSSTI